MVRIARGMAVLFAGIFIAVGPLHAAWQRAANKHFVIYADMVPARLQQFADRLERFDAAMRFVTKAQESTPVSIYVVSDLEEVRRLSGRRRVGGHYRGNAQEPFVVVPPRYRAKVPLEHVGRIRG